MMPNKPNDTLHIFRIMFKNLVDFRIRVIAYTEKL